MSEGKNVPNLRFPGFDREWKKKTIGDCFSERVESDPDGELLSVTINSGIKKFSEIGKHDNSNEDKSKYKKVVKGDIAYNSMRMWQGASGYSDYNGIVSPAYTVITPKKDIDSKFFSYLFKRGEMIQVFQARSQGITSDTWNLKFPLLKEISLYCPENLVEQKIIAEYLMGIDVQISICENELDKWKELKKGMLQKMFPKEGKSVPEIRFPGFSDLWIEYNYGDIAEYKKGPFGSALRKDIFVIKGNRTVKIYEQQNAINKDWKLERYFITEEYAKKMKGFFVGGGDIIVSCAGTIGEIYELPLDADSGIINQALMKISVNESIVDKKWLITRNCG